MVARSHPQMVRRIADAGHEIACHSGWHVPVNQLSRQDFSEDARTAKALLEDITGTAVVGYRAPEFSIRRRGLWALNALCELGYRYDSSIFPIFHRRYGIAHFSRRAGCYQLAQGSSIYELPPATARVSALNIPVAGGGYFRLFPLALLARAFEQNNRAQLANVTYFHPYEFDPAALDILETVPAGGLWQRLQAWRINLQYNLGRPAVPSKVAALLKRFRFTTCLQLVNQLHASECRALL
jgi:polysaccharide deacetylase family protein (PEP-CTERM system associated)